MTKVGLLGAGYICDAHARALKARADVEIAAVCDRSVARANAAASRYRIAHSFSSLDDMLASELHAVHVLLPAPDHLDAARRIVESGRHALIEKPMGLDSSACDQLVQQAQARGVKLGVSHNFLFLSAYERLRRDMHDGTLGPLDQLTLNWLYPLDLVRSGPFDHWVLRRPEGVLFELGVHLLAFVMDLIGPLEDLQASASLPLEYDDGAVVYRRWQVHGVRGRTAVDVQLSVVPGPAERSVMVRGYGGLARCDLERNVYYRDRPSGYGLVFDHFYRSCSVAAQVGAAGLRNLGVAGVGMLTQSHRANPFLASVARSIHAFYDGLADPQLDPRLDARFGAAVIAECERVLANVALTPTRQAPSAPVTNPHQASVLVTGGTGFIGRHLVRALTERGFGVRVATRNRRSAQTVLAGLPVDIVEGDLADTGFLDAALEGIELVYDLAKATGSRWEDYYRQDVLVTQALAERALARRVKRFFYLGTIDSYYSAEPGAVITSDTALDPQIEERNLYARSKAACEALLRTMHRDQGLPVVIFRPGIVIGPGTAPAHWGVGLFVSDTRVRFWGDGRNFLPFVLVEDVVQALILAMDRPGIEGQTFLLTDAPLLSGRDYVEALSQACGTRVRASTTPVWRLYLADLAKESVKHLIRHPNRRRPSYRDWASRTHRARYDSSKTQQVLGWQPAGRREALIERGIVGTVQDYLR